MKILKLIIIASFFAVIVAANGLSADGFVEKMISSMKSSEIEEKGNASYHWKKKFGNETVSLTFPKKPFTMKEDGIFIATAKSGKIGYLFATPSPQESVDSSEALEEALWCFDSYPYAIVEHSQSHKGAYDVFSLTVIDEEEDTFIIIKCYVTSNSFYMAAATYPIKQDDKKAVRYIDSFSIKP